MNHITGGGFMKIFHVHCQPDMLLELILHHFQRQKYLIGYNSKAILTQMKCITFLIWVLAIQLSLMKKMHHALKILAEQDVEAYQIGHIVKNESTAIELLGYNNG